MKHPQQNILIILGMALVLTSLVACGAAPEPTPTPLTVQFIIPPTPLVEPVAVAQPVQADMSQKIEPVVNTTGVIWDADGSAVTGAESTLVRMEHGLYATFSAAGLQPGDALTLWWVIFNKPENCSAGACGPDDAFLVDETGTILKDEAGARRPNPIGRATTELSQLTGPGAIVGQDGRAKFLARLPIEDLNEAQFGPGLLHPMTAEVHLIIRTHGPAAPNVIQEQLTTQWGGCPAGWPKDPCRDMQLAVHSSAGR